MNSDRFRYKLVLSACKSFARHWKKQANAVKYANKLWKDYLVTYRRCNNGYYIFIRCKYRIEVYNIENMNIVFCAYSYKMQENI